MRARVFTPILILLACCRAQAQPAAFPLPVLDVPFISQSEALCGGAAAAMVLRYWGARGLTAESFAYLLDRRAAGIPTTALIADLKARGWNATGVTGTDDLLAGEIARGRPVVALIEDRPRIYHYVVVVAMYDSGIVFHDPARAPYRAMARAEFARRWRAAEQWMAVVVPGEQPEQPERRGEERPSTPETVSSLQPCGRLIADGVARASANDLEGAERLLTSALSCSGGAASRELAGVRVLQQRWPEAEELAATATSEDATDQYAWRVLATSRFVQNKPLAALDAWNVVGEPTVDIVSADGLVHTRARVLERLIAVDAGEVFTRQTFTLARRRLEDLPSAVSSRLEYVPVPGGLAEVHAHVFERPLAPRGPWAYVALGATAAATREVRVDIGSLSGGGERFTASWRFWPNRQRIGLDLEAPARWGGVWGLQAFDERQPFDRADIATAHRASVHAIAGNWIAPGVRLSFFGGVDRWNERGTMGAVGTQLRVRSGGDRVEGVADIDGFLGSNPFATASATLRGQTSTTRRGLVLTSRATIAMASVHAPIDLWWAGDTGRVRPELLRAHAVIEDGALKTDRLGRALVNVSGESQYWWRPSPLVAIAAATFADAGRTSRRLQGTAVADVDVGTGARIAVLTLPGVFRIDVAKGLRDGAVAVTVAYER